jgi:Tfp pilus assembly protein PilF
MTIRKIKQAQLIRVFKDLNGHHDDGCCFLLGAGASVASGIPSGGALARRWYAELQEDMPGDELAAWHKEIDFVANRVAEFYPQIFERRFRNHPATGYYQLQDCMKKAEPSIGYSFLAQVLANTQHKFVITTNFDHMVEDAIRTFTSERPLVCGHESLAQYINARSIRPTIIKVHRDLLLHPFNDTQNTDKLNEAWKTTLIPILQHYHLVIIGYGGNDGSLMDYLENIEKRKGIYWCCRNESEINDKIRATLNHKDDCIVEIDGFDEFMLALNNAFGYPLLIDSDDLAQSQMVKIALEKAKRYQQQFDQFGEKTATATKETSEDKAATSEALLKLSRHGEESQQNWWQIQLKINQEKDPQRQCVLYKRGLQLFPKSAELHGNYAIFLEDIRKDYDGAEQHYRKALELDTDDADYNGNYAIFLEDIRKDYDGAEQHYRKALVLVPDDADYNGNYANFLKDIRKDYDGAEQHYRKALELAPDDANINGNYAIFLKDIRKDYDGAEQHYRKALELAPDDANINGNYALFLEDIRKDYDGAEQYYRKALELAPDHANINGNYALFLEDIRKDYDGAEQYYRKALVLAPDDADYNGNYAGFLLAQGKTEAATPYLEKALRGEREDLLLECEFYRLAHYPALREEAKHQIERLLQKGSRSTHWDFSANIERAVLDGYPDPEELRRIAARIAEEQTH